MTLRTPHAIDGADYPADQVRMMTKAATLGAQGIIDVGDLAVRPLLTPGPGVRIGGGQGLALGRDGLSPGETSGQGTYSIWNEGDHVVEVAGTAGADARTDLLIVRVEDPTWPASGWSHDPEAGAVMNYPYTVQGVPAGTKALPSAYKWTALPLARIEWPPNTSTVTAEMIKSVRTVANAKILTDTRDQRGVSPIDQIGNVHNPDWENAPDLVWDDVLIPIWATQVTLKAFWGGMLFGTRGAVTGPPARPALPSGGAQGRYRISLGYGASGGPTDIVTGTAAYNHNNPGTNLVRLTDFCVDTRPVPKAMRGQMANLRMQASGSADVTGRMELDDASNFFVEYTFREVAVDPVDA